MNYREQLNKLNIDGAFRQAPYVRRVIRYGPHADSDGNNWGET